MKRELVVGANEIALRWNGKVLAREPFTPGDSPNEPLHRLMKPGMASVHCVRIASSHARMLLLPWVPQLTTRERWNALAASRFEQTYGEPPEEWTLRVADDMPPQPRLMAAVPAAMLRALNQLVKPRRIVIGLLDAVGSLLAQEPTFHGCAAEIGSDRASLLMICRGQLRRVRCRRFENFEGVSAAVRSEWATACAADLDREDPKARSAAHAAGTVAILGAGTPAGAALAAAIGGSRVLELA